MSKLDELKKEAKRLEKTAQRKDHSYEALCNAVNRSTAILKRLESDTPSAAEKKLIPQIKKAKGQLVKKRDEAKKIRDQKEGHLKKLRIRIKAIRQRRHKGSGYNGEMQDSTDPAQFVNPKAVAGYVGGYWPTYGELQQRYPDLPKLSYAINASENADALDVEPGDATPSEAPAWVRRQDGKVAIYGSISSWAGIDQILGAAGLERGKDYLRITAHYNGISHRCTSACGYGFEGEADATQWTDRGYGHNLDLNLCAGIPWHK